MGNKNYSKFSQRYNKKFDQNENTVEVNNQVIDGQVSIDEIENVITEPIETVKPVDVVDVTNLSKGIVICAKLNVRKGPSKDTESLCVIEKDTKVTLYNEQTEDFFKICTASGIEGYCMKQFIKVI